MLSSFLSFLLNLAIGFLGIGLVVFIHELGHFCAARLLHIDVETLSFGMGPVIYSHMGKSTEFCISVLPFGGYCRIKGSVELTKALKEKAKTFTHTEKGSFFGTTPFIRFLIFLSGPITNFLLSILLFTCVYSFSTTTISNDARVLNISSYPTLYNQEFGQDEICNGDLIISLDDTEIEDYEEAVSVLSQSNGKALKATVLRDGKILDITLTPFKNGEKYSFGLALYQEPIVGRAEKGSSLKKHDKILSVNGKQINNTNDFYQEALESDILNLEIERNGKMVNTTISGGNSFEFAWETGYKRVKGLNFFSSLKTGFLKTFSVSKTTIEALNNIFRFKSNTEEVRNTITGPTRAAQTIGSITMLGAETSIFIGLRALLYLLAIVSISICIANLLPIPNFDGGQMLINLYAMITHKDITPRGYVVLQVSGLICTILILIFMYGLDLVHYLNN